jgi:hypothetical protein
MIAERRIDLSCHPSTPVAVVRAIQVLVRRSDAELDMTFRLDGDISRIRIPEPAAPRINTRLWQHTCFEAFVAVDGYPAYHEFNFAPSGEWAVWAFSSYRNGGPLSDDSMRPDIAVRAGGDRVELDCRVRLDRVSAIPPLASLRVGLAAVVEAGDRSSYWAMRHPATKPDFHNADGFALLLKAPGTRE